MKSIYLIIIGGVVLFLQGLIGKILWSIVLFINRGELNHDNNESTPDKFLHVNPNTDRFTTRYVIKYTLKGVHWGFFYKGKWVGKFSFWLDWADDRKNRFPWPIDIEDVQSEQAVLSLLKGGK